MTLDQRSDEVSHLRELVRTLSTRLAEAHDVLRMVEWRGPARSCPACHRGRPIKTAPLGPANPGHAPDCRLDKAAGP